MPPSSKYAFQLTIDGAQAVADAKKWRAQIQKELAAPMKGTAATGGAGGLIPTGGAGGLASLAPQAAQAQKGVQGLAGGMTQATNAAAAMHSAVSALAALGITKLAVDVARTTWELGQFGAQTMRSRDSFNELARQAGGVGAELLESVRNASGQTISEYQAMQAVSRGILLKMGADAQQWGDLMEVARFRARAMGIDTTQALADITTGIGRESRLILDNLGIIVDTEQVMANYARSIGTTADQLDEAQRKQAIMTAVIQEGQAQIQAAGGMTDDYADSFEQLNASLEDLKMAAGELAAPAVAQLASGLNVLAQAAQGNLGPLRELAAGWRGYSEEMRYGASFLVNALDKLGLLDDVARSMGKLTGPIDYSKQALDGWYMAAGGAARQAEILGLSVEGASDSIGSMAARMEQGERAAQRYEGRMASLVHTLNEVKRDITGIDLGEISSDFSSAAGQLASGIVGVSGSIGLDQAEVIHGRYLDQLEALYMEVEARHRKGTDMTELELAYRRARIMAAFDAEIGVYKEGYDKQEELYEESARQAEQAQQAFRSAVAGMFAPTDVTDLDMAQSGAGVYRDKWDEYARRVRAAMTDMQSEFRGMIPTDIELAGEGAIQEWGQRQLDAFYAGLMPDQVNWDAFAADFSRKIAEQVGKENLIDRAIQELAARGITAGRADVQKALGITSQLETIVFGGLSPEEAGTQLSTSIGTALANVQIDPAAINVGTGEGGGLAAQLFAGVTGEQVMEPVLAGLSQMQLDAGQLDAPGNQIARGLFDGFQVHIAEQPWTRTATTALLRDIRNNEWMLIEAGKAIGKPLWDGLLSMVRGSGIVNHIVAEVLSALADSL